MIIREVRIHSYRLRLREPWVTARGTLDAREGWRVEVVTDDGAVGFGDCAPLEGSGTESPGVSAEMLEEHSERLVGTDARSAVETLDIGHAPAARCALETAILDLLARAEGVPLARYLNREAVAEVRVNANVGTPEAAEARIASAVAAGFDVVKFKVGVEEPARELATLDRLFQKFGADVRFRLDANRAWDDVTAREVLEALRGTPVESLEEPVRSPDLDYLKRLQTTAPFPLALDESIPGLGPAEVCAAGAVSRLVLKPTVLGGPMAAFRIAHLAMQTDIECVVTTALESAVGVWTAVHLAAAVDGLDGPGQHRAHGLATGEWLAEDVVVRPAIGNARIAVPQAPGLGCPLENGT